MLPLRIMICFYGVLPDTTQFFTYMNGGFVFVVDYQQYFFHSVLLCQFQSKAKKSQFGRFIITRPYDNSILNNK